MTLHRIIEQDWPDIEIVIVDGQSTDGTVDIIRRLEEKLSARDNAEGKSRTLLWVSELDGGLYDALNKSVKLSTGDYLIVANDLLVKKDMLSRLAHALESGNHAGAHADLVYADVPVLPDKPVIPVRSGSRIRRYWHMGNSHRLWTGWMPGHPALLLKREIYEKYGLYKTDYRIAADYEFMVRFLKGAENRLAYVPKVLVRMYYGGTSTSHFSDYVESFAEGVRALRENHTPLPLALITTAFRTVRVLLQFPLSKRKPTPRKCGIITVNFLKK